MKRSGKVLIFFGVAVLGAITAAGFFSVPKRGNLIASIPFFTGRTPEQEKFSLLSYSISSLPGKTIHLKHYVSTYRIAEDFTSLNDRLKPELKPRAYSASSYPNKNPYMTVYGIGDPSKSNITAIHISSIGKGLSEIRIQEQMPVTALDRAQLWFEGLMGKRKSSGIARAVAARKGP